MGVKDLIKQALIEKENKAYRLRLKSYQVPYRDWAAALEAGRPEVEPESADRRDFVVISCSEGCLSEHALLDISSYFYAHPETMFLYGDEDVWPGRGQGAERTDERRSPWFKPDWSPDLFYSWPYFGSLVAVDKLLYEKMQSFYDGQNENQSVFIRGDQDGIDLKVTDFAAYALWLYRITAVAGAYQKGSIVIGHIPSILFHCSDEAEQMKFLEDTPSGQNNRSRCLQDFLDGRILLEPHNGVADNAELPEPVVSVIIPSKDHPDILKKCLQGCKAAARGREEKSQGGGKEKALSSGREKFQCNGEEKSQSSREKKPQRDGKGTEVVLPMEIILVDNGSSPESRAKVEELLREMKSPCFQLHYVYEPMEFHFSKMCNLGAEHAKGQFLLFLNDDVELCLPGCIEQMAAMADREYTGAVGMKLYYPDSDRIQHAGITNLPMGPVHKLQFLNDNICYYYKTNRGWRNVLAVTAACLMVNRDKFAEAGGFSEELRVAFNDVDLCFQLYELGYWNVCMNDLYAYHHESLSRGDDEAPEKLERLLQERDLLYRRHPELAGQDPYYSIYLNRQGLDTRIRPAYEIAANKVGQPGESPRRFDSTGWRRDNCLLVRIEDSHDDMISGYGVVLGDNNACYNMRLLFKSAAYKDLGLQGQDALPPNGENERAANIYAVSIMEQYRPDLEENMPDQVNVALSGFAVKLTEDFLPPGSYQLGLAARNKVTGLRLINWSNRVIRR